MENETPEIEPSQANPPRPKNRFIAAGVFLAVAIVAGAWNASRPPAESSETSGRLSPESPAEEGIVLPVHWGDTGSRLAGTGVIDRQKIELLYADNPVLKGELEKLLSGSDQEMRLTEQNAPLLLNLFWALGLGTKNKILDEGPMMDPRYAGAGPPAGGFASTGGWTLAKGGAMDHYSRHPFVVLTADEQALVEKMSKNIYRPCCGNPAHFPDCNHGMAMLGLLELMAKEGAGEEQMYATALEVQRRWFPAQYQTIAHYLQSRGKSLATEDPKKILGPSYSSASAYRSIEAQVQTLPPGGGGSCGV